MAEPTQLIKPFFSCSVVTTDSVGFPVEDLVNNVSVDAVHFQSGRAPGAEIAVLVQVLHRDGGIDVFKLFQELKFASMRLDLQVCRGACPAEELLNSF